MSKWNPSKEDIVKVCEAITGNFREVGTGRYPDYCSHCLADESYKTGESIITHDSDCPVLIAQDILTGAYEDKQDD